MTTFFLIAALQGRIKECFKKHGIGIKNVIYPTETLSLQTKQK